MLKKLSKYGKSYSNWSLFKEELTNIKRKVKKGEQNSNDLRSFVEPLQKELDSLNIAIDVLRLHDLIQNRNTLAHEKKRSVQEQEDFMDLIISYSFSSKFMYNDLIQTMINQLKRTTLKRYTN